MSAGIEFQPVCSNCGKVIYDIVNVEQNVPAINDRGVNSVSYFVEPRRCKRCGVFFDYISAPTRLPYDNRREMSICD